MGNIFILYKTCIIINNAPLLTKDFLLTHKFLMKLESIIECLPTVMVSFNLFKNNIYNFSSHLVNHYDIDNFKKRYGNCR